MKLFKNVDIKDLDSILTKGILSANKSNNHNWDASKRADNSEEVVYLFKPTTSKNSYTQYGLALVEIEIDENDVKVNELTECDHNDYVEYIVDEVRPEQIVNVYIPQIAVYSNRFEISDFVKAQVTFVKINSDIRYITKDPDYIYSTKTYTKKITEISKEQLKEWFKNATINSDTLNFFRGDIKNRPVELLNIIYAI